MGSSKNSQKLCERFNNHQTFYDGKGRTNNMRICLIQSGAFGDASYGILTTAKAAKKSGHTVTLIGTQKGLKEIWEFKRDLLLKALYRFNPDVVGFSVMTPYADYLQPVSKFIKYHFPKVIIVAGGNHIYARKENVLKENPDVDYIFLGESEILFPLFLKSIENRDGQFTALDGIGFRTGKDYKINPMACAGTFYNDMLVFESLYDVAPEFDIYSKNIFKSGIAYVLLTRGCPFQCTYCAHPRDDIVQKNVRHISLDMFEQQLKVFLKMGVTSLLIADAEFNLNKKWAYQIMDIMLKHRVKLFWVNLKIELVSEGFIKRLKDLGIEEVSLPIESGSPRIRNEIYNRGNVSDEQIFKAFECIKKYDILCSTNMIVGAPDETLQDIEMTKEMLLRVDADAPLVLTLVPLPGTLLFDKYRESIAWKRYEHFDLAHDSEETLFEDEKPKCNFQIEVNEFYKQVQLLEAIIHPLAIILRRNFQLEGKEVFFFATCEYDTALKILRMFIAGKVKAVTIFLPEKDLIRLPFEEYDNVKIEKIPQELAHIQYAVSNSKIIIPKFILTKLAHRFGLFQLQLEELIKKILSRFPAFLKCNILLRKFILFVLSIKYNVQTKKWIRYLKSRYAQGTCDYMFFEEKIGTYRDMVAISKCLRFSSIGSLNFDDLSLNKITLTATQRRIEKIKYYRKMGNGKQRLYKKYLQHP